MYVPSLPSESLYKFNCFGGLALLIVAVVLYMTDAREEELKLLETTYATNLLVNKSKNDVAKWRNLKVEMKRIAADLKIDIASTDTSITLISSKYSLKPDGPASVLFSKLKEINELEDQIQVDSYTIEKNMELRNNINDQLDRFHFILSFITGFGLALFIFGFINWKRKIQIHQDAILERDSLKAKKEIFQLKKELKELEEENKSVEKPSSPTLVEQKPSI